MPDREKVINALHCRAYDDDFPCWKCAYYKQDEKPVARCDYRRLMDDAIALLKEQEAKSPAIMQDIEGIWSTCSMCGHKLRPILAMKMDTYFPKFCSECGQEVKWE